MLVAGDEIGRTQGGNNNAYCQDNEISWVNWELEPWQQELLRFTRGLVRLREEQPVLRRRRFFEGRKVRDSADIAWFKPDGTEFEGDEWWDDGRGVFGLRLAGDALTEVDDDGRPIEGDTLLVLFNATDAALDFTLPAYRRGRRWQRLFDTSARRVPRTPVNSYHLNPRSLAILRLGTRNA